MVINNKIIREIAQKLVNLSISLEVCLPIRISFYLSKNIQTIQNAYEEIERARLSIGERFGVPNNRGTGYDILPENIEIAQSELNDLLNLEQDLNIHMFKLSDFNGIELTFEQMSAIIFMIEE